MYARTLGYLLAVGAGLCAVPTTAQSIPHPDTAIGNSPLASYDVSEIDNVNPLNGNLYLNLPLVSFPQAGRDLRLDFRVYYNDKAWSIYFKPSATHLL